MAQAQTTSPKARPDLSPRETGKLKCNGHVEMNKITCETLYYLVSSNLYKECEKEWPHSCETISDKILGLPVFHFVLFKTVFQFFVLEMRTN